MRLKKACDITREEIERVYVNESKASLVSVSKLLGCSYRELKKAMEHYGIPIGRSGRRASIPELTDRDWLEKELRTKSLKQIAKELNSSVGNVADHAYRHGIRWRGQAKSASIKAALAQKYPDGRFGSQASNWRGGRRRGGCNGEYVLIYSPDHPHAKNKGYVLEHRLIMEQHLGRYLDPLEVVHHKNGIKHDNRIENLELVESKAMHVKTHFAAVKVVAQQKEEIAALRAELASLKAER